jgi:hypothetical protein
LFDFDQEFIHGPAQLRQATARHARLAQENQIHCAEFRLAQPEGFPDYAFDTIAHYGPGTALARDRDTEAGIPEIVPANVQSEPAGGSFARTLEDMSKIR